MKQTDGTAEHKKSEKQPHADHRQRIFDRAAREGFDHFEPHELLEVLLFFSKPRVNTNPTAHDLFNRFGSIKGVMDADEMDVCAIDGVGPKSAALLKLVIELMRRYERDCFCDGPSYRTLERVAQYLHPYFVGLNHERLYVMLFNNRMNLIDCKCVSDGTVNSTDINLSKISADALRKNAAAVILAHNHPNGFAKPSQEDVDLNLEIRNHLGVFGIVLVEHLIFSDHSYQAIMRNEGLFRVSPITHKQDVGFYQKFYQDCSFEIPQFFDHESTQEL